jgi:hypothetical protein
VDSLAFAQDGQTLAATSGGRIHLWEQISDSATPVVPPPRQMWPQLLATPTGQTRPFAVRPTAAEFIADALRLPWFARIGQPSDRDDTCVRLAGWNDWSPTDDYDQFTEHQQGWVDAIGLFARTFDRPDVTDLFERTRGQVVDAARRHVPYDDEADGYHPPSVAVWNAAYTAATVACFLELGWRVPVDLEQRWAWFAAGYWPCDRDGDRPPYRLVVL